MFVTSRTSGCPGREACVLMLISTSPKRRAKATCFSTVMSWPRKKITPYWLNASSTRRKVSASRSRARSTPRISAPSASPVGTMLKAATACIALPSMFQLVPFARKLMHTDALGFHRPMRAHERAYLAHRERNTLPGLLPRIEAHFGLRCEHRRFHGDGVRVRRNVVRQHQYGRLAVAHEIARHGDDEIGVGAVHLGQEFIGHLHRDFGPVLDQLGGPALHVVIIKMIAHLRTGTARLYEHGSDDALGGPLQQVPDHGTAHAEAHHHEFL